MPTARIIAVLKQAEAGSPVPEMCREHCISNAIFYKWRSKFGGMEALLMACMKELEEENQRLKKIYVEERLKAEIVAAALAKNGCAISAAGDGARAVQGSKLTGSRVGIANFCWHYLRHTWVSWLIQNGTPLYDPQEMGGWKSAAMVRRYTWRATRR